MLPTAIILFREVLEISIILTIVLAATRGVPGRGRYVLLGITGGVLGSALVALFADAIAEAAQGMGQEVFNAAILMVAVGMIGWTAVWMKKHAKELAMKIRATGQAARDGELPLTAIAVLVAVSMWREGAEIVLFMASQLATRTEPVSALILGALGGGAAAALIGALMYFGLLRMPTKLLFSVTGWLLILLACGMSAQAAMFLGQAALIPELATPLWDTSGLLSDESPLTRVLHPMLGYTAQPTGMQVVWYAVTLAVILGLLKWQKTGETKTPAQKIAAAQS